MQPELSSSIHLFVCIGTEPLKIGFAVGGRESKSLVLLHTTSKQIELEGPGCSDFDANLMSFKT